jgi:hypothetical protein
MNYVSNSSIKRWQFEKQNLSEKRLESTSWSADSTLRYELPGKSFVGFFEFHNVLLPDEFVIRYFIVFSRKGWQKTAWCIV